MIVSPWRRPGAAVLGACSFLFLAGCGYMNGGSTQAISVRSAPTEAQITTDPGSGLFTTPTTLVLERKTAYTIVARKDGYHDAHFRLRKVRRVGILAADVALSFMAVGIPAIVDASTGGWWELQPDPAIITLQRTDDSVDGPEFITVALAKPAFPIPGGLAVTSSEVVEIEVIRE